MHILLVEDDAAVAGSIVDGLQEFAHTVDWVRTGADALAAPAADLVLLDLGLPDVDGRDVCRELRARGAVPIVILTARGDEADRVLGLELGADDYVTKPFGFRELLARIRAVQRRTQPRPAGDGTSDDLARFGPLMIDTRTRRATIHGDEVRLTVKEYDLLAYLAEDAGAVCSRIDIVERVWDSAWFGPTKTIDAHVTALRRKLGGDVGIVAVRGVGYRLELRAEAERRDARRGGTPAG